MCDRSSHRHGVNVYVFEGVHLSAAKIFKSQDIRSLVAPEER